MKQNSRFPLAALSLALLAMTVAHTPRSASAQTTTVSESNVPLWCQTLLPITQPSVYAVPGSVAATYWLVSVNFQEVGWVTAPDGSTKAGVAGCLKIMGRDPQDISAPYVKLADLLIECQYSTQQILGHETWADYVDYGGTGTITYGPPTLDAAHYGGTGTGLWRPITFSGGAHVKCENLDISARTNYEALPLPNSTAYASVPPVSRLKHFSMAVAGNSFGTSGTLEANPLVTYVPDQNACNGEAGKGCKTTALYSQLWHGGSDFMTLGSVFNGSTTNAGTILDTRYPSNPTQYLHMAFNGDGISTTSTPVAYHRFDLTAAAWSTPVRSYSRPVSTTPDKGQFRLWTGQSSIYIGANPAAVTQGGTFYEVVVDPSGDSRPPAQ